MLGKARVRFIQEQLNAHGFNCGEADGLAGTKTYAALAASGAVPKKWAKKRKLVGYIQWLCAAQDIDAGTFDGYWGPQTEFAYDALREQLDTGRPAVIWRPEELGRANPNKWPIQTPQKELVKFYGEPGKNQTFLHVPYPHRLAWKLETKLTRFQCHEKVHVQAARL